MDFALLCGVFMAAPPARPPCLKDRAADRSPTRQFGTPFSKDLYCAVRRRCAPQSILLANSQQFLRLGADPAEVIQVLAGAIRRYPANGPLVPPPGLVQVRQLPVGHGQPEP